jgi:hypothetical protein
MSRPVLSSRALGSWLDERLLLNGKKRGTEDCRSSCFYSHSFEPTGFGSVHDGHTKLGGRFNLVRGLPAGVELLKVQEGHEVARPKRRYEQFSGRSAS